MNEDRAVEIQEVDTSSRIHERVANLTHLAVNSHKKIIQEVGGSPGMRDKSALDSAIGSAFATFSGQDLHESVHDKAAALMRSISLNHPFNDGNKRTSLVITAAFLFEHGYGFKDEVADDEIVDFCIQLADGKRAFPEITDWLRANTNGASARSFVKVMEQLSSV